MQTQSVKNLVDNSDLDFFCFHTTPHSLVSFNDHRLSCRRQISLPCYKIQTLGNKRKTEFNQTRLSNQTVHPQKINFGLSY